MGKERLCVHWIQNIWPDKGGYVRKKRSLPSSAYSPADSKKGAHSESGYHAACQRVPINEQMTS